MKRAGGATPSRRSAAARPPLRMFEVDQPRCARHRLGGGLRGVVGQVGGEGLALVAGVVEDHAALRRLRTVPWLSCPVVHAEGDDDDLALAGSRSTAAPRGHAVRAAEVARVGQVADVIGHVGEVHRVRAAVVRQRRGQLVAGRRVARALDHEPVVLHHLDLGRVGEQVGAERRVDADQPHPRRRARHAGAERAAPAGVEERRAGACRRAARMSVCRRQELAATRNARSRSASPGRSAALPGWK